MNFVRKLLGVFKPNRQPIDYNTLIQGIIDDQLYDTQPLKRIILCFSDKRLVQLITNTDNHGYIFIVNEHGEIVRE